MKRIVMANVFSGYFVEPGVFDIYYLSVGNKRSHIEEPEKRLYKGYMIVRKSVNLVLKLAIRVILVPILIMQRVIVINLRFSLKSVEVRGILCG